MEVMCIIKADVLIYVGMATTKPKCSRDGYVLTSLHVPEAVRAVALSSARAGCMPKLDCAIHEAELGHNCIAVCKEGEKKNDEGDCETFHADGDDIENIIEDAFEQCLSGEGV